MTETVLEARGLTKSFGAVRASRAVSLDLRPVTSRSIGIAFSARADTVAFQRWSKK